MGNIAYFEIPADDVERARKFYMSVFGWDIRKVPMEGVPPDYHGVMTGKATVITGGNYDMSQLNSGGMMKRTFPGQPIMNYVNVDDLDATLAKVKENGGEQQGETMKIPNVGRVAFLKDSEGNLIGAWEPVKMG